MPVCKSTNDRSMRKLKAKIQNIKRLNTKDKSKKMKVKTQKAKDNKRKIPF